LCGKSGRFLARPPLEAITNIVSGVMPPGWAR
jgi:hypothetical protein